MKTFPMFLKMDGRTVVVVGNGEAAAQKCRLALKTEARVLVVANLPEPELDGLARAGRITLVAEDQAGCVFDTAALVFVATGCKGADAAWSMLAKARGALVNVVDAPDLCDAFTPSIVDRDPVVVAIGTEGTAPVLGRQIKTRIEEILEPRLGHFARVCGSLRGAVAQRVAPSDRRAFWRWVFAGPPRQLYGAGSERDAIAAVKSAIDAGHAPEDDVPLHAHTIVSDGLAPDMVTLRDIRHLQEADIIYYDLDGQKSVLEFARRDALRHFTGAGQGRTPMPEAELARHLRQARAGGQRVVVIRRQALDTGLGRLMSASGTKRA